MPPQGVVVLWIGVGSSQCAKQTLLQGFENGGEGGGGGLQRHIYVIIIG